MSMKRDGLDVLESSSPSAYRLSEPAPPSLFSARWAAALFVPVLFSITFNTPLQFYIKDFVPWMWDLPARHASGTVCIRNASSGGLNPICKPRCPKGEFALPGMKACRPWLTCEHFRTIVKGPLVGAGAVKDVFFARWDGFPVALSELKRPDFLPDFVHGKEMLRTLQPSLQVVQFVGSCGEAYLTEYHHLGDASRLEEIFTNHIVITTLDNISTRFRMCLDFVRAITFLHSHDRVMCDGNDLAKMLSQFLITDDLRLILNDVDALPEVDHQRGEFVVCGHRRIGGSSEEEDNYVAPEQKWPFEDLPFDEKLQPRYDEKIDVWKIPDTCDFLMGDVDGADHARFHLFDVNEECKKKEPEERPPAGDALAVYQAVCEHLEIACY